MKKVEAYRIILLFISISLIFDFFFIVIEISSGRITSGLTIFDRAFIDKIPLGKLFINEEINHNYSNPIYLLTLLSPVLIIVFLFLSRNNRKFKLKESNLIFPISIIGLLIYSLFVIFFARYIDETSAIFCTTKGYFGWLVGILKYAIMVYLTYQIRIKYKNNDKIIKIDISTIFFLSIMTELILMFFFTPINNRISYEIYDGPMGYSKKDYTKFMYSPFYMMFRYKNYALLDGKDEFYPYMMIMLICYIASFVLAFFKNKRNYIITIVLLSISILVLIIGAVDCTNSFMTRYMTNKNPNFINCIGISFYIIILLTASLIFLRVMQVMDINIIKKNEEAINADEYVKIHENEINIEGGEQE